MRRLPQTLEGIENAQSNTLPTDEKHRDIREKSTSDIHSNLSNSDISRKTTFEKEQVRTTDFDESSDSIGENNELQLLEERENAQADRFTDDERHLHNEGQ